MQEHSEDKAERILSIYKQLKQGKVVKKAPLSTSYGVSERTIQRDITDIQCFLQNQELKTGDIEEIIFDKRAGGYVLHTTNRRNLESKDILAVGKILLQSRALVKTELFPILFNLIKACSDNENQKMIEDLLRNEMHHYIELPHGKKLLDIIWSLEQAITEQNYVRVKYQKYRDTKTVEYKLKPVGIIYSDSYFCLTAYNDSISNNEFPNSTGTFPEQYRIDRFIEYEILEAHFRVPYSDRFEEGEFRKRME